MEELVKPGCLIAASNLFVRRDERINWPSVSFSELSTITCKPRATHLRNALEKLQKSIGVSLKGEGGGVFLCKNVLSISHAPRDEGKGIFGISSFSLNSTHTTVLVVCILV